MFKSIEYKLMLYLFLLIVSVAATTYLAMNGKFVYCMLTVAAVVFSLRGISKHYRKFNQNILFLLNALENGDYSFSFTENKISLREKEFNQMMNRIKDILVKAREGVIENEKFLSIIIESVSTGIVIMNESGSVIRTNQIACRLLGLPVFTHIKQLAKIEKDFPDRIEELLPEGEKTIKIVNDRDELQLSFKAFEVPVNKNKTRIITISNIGNALEAREIEAWIKLIRVMTHEIMNSIAPITSITETMLYSYKDEEKRSESDRNMIEALQTINTTAKGLLNFVDSYRKFSGIPQPQPTNFDLKKLIRSTVSLYGQRLEDENIKVEIDPDDSPVFINADENQIGQILTNLIKNATEALTGTTDALIRIRIMRRKNKPIVSIENNGASIPDDILPHIFIPFFTTKDAGTGIGLSISRYIMRLHGGNLKHHTEDGRTVFSMVF